jgi:hypothetical protein
MPKNHEIFVAHLERVFGREEVIRKHAPQGGGLPVCVFTYRDFPEKGMMTGVTYGLSFDPHPDWKLSRPEMILSVESEETMWGWAAAYFCAEFRGKKPFRYGDVFTVDSPLARDTRMDGVFVFAQSILHEEVASVQLNDYKVHFSQFYPIYRSEVKVFDRIGLERFWKHEGFEIYNPKRPPIEG